MSQQIKGAVHHTCVLKIKQPVKKKFLKYQITKKTTEIG